MQWYHTAMLVVITTVCVIAVPWGASVLRWLCTIDVLHREHEERIRTLEGKVKKLIPLRNGAVDGDIELCVDSRRGAHDADFHHRGQRVLGEHGEVPRRIFEAGTH